VQVGGHNTRRNGFGYRAASARAARGHLSQLGPGMRRWVARPGPGLMVGLHGQAGAGMSRGMLAGRAGFAWLDDAGLVGQDDGLDPVAQAELGEQVAHV
jgi:hypothetical protein